MFSIAYSTYIAYHYQPTNTVYIMSIYLGYIEFGRSGYYGSSYSDRHFVGTTYTNLLQVLFEVGSEISTLSRHSVIELRKLFNMVL